MQWFVPHSEDIDLDMDGSAPELLVFQLVGWHEETEPHDHDEDGEACEGHMVTVFPVLLSRCKGGGWHSPGHVWFTGGHVFSDYDEALAHAALEIQEAKADAAEVEALEAMVNGVDAVES